MSTVLDMDGNGWNFLAVCFFHVVLCDCILYLYFFFISLLRWNFLVWSSVYVYSTWSRSNTVCACMELVSPGVD